MKVQLAVITESGSSEDITVLAATTRELLEASVEDWCKCGYEAEPELDCTYDEYRENFNVEYHDDIPVQGA